MVNHVKDIDCVSYFTLLKNIIWLPSIYIYHNEINKKKKEQKTNPGGLVRELKSKVEPSVAVYLQGTGSPNVRDR